MNWVQQWVRRMHRANDVKLLWPTYRASTSNRLEAEEAFRIHMVSDPAYSDLDDFEKLRFLKELP